MSLPELMAKLGQARKARQDAYEAYQMHKMIEDDRRGELEMKLRSEGLRSARNDEYSVAITARPTIQITNEAVVMDWLRHQPDIEPDLYIGVKKTQFDTLARIALKATGEIVPGTEVIETEYLSIKANRKEQNNGKDY